MSLFQELWQSANPSSAPGGDASSIAFTPAGSIAATTVQSAIEEVAAESAGTGGGSATDSLANLVLAQQLGAL